MLTASLAPRLNCWLLSTSCDIQQMREKMSYTGHLDTALSHQKEPSQVVWASNRDFPGCLHMEVFQVHPTGRRGQGRPSTSGLGSRKRFLRTRIDLDLDYFQPTPPQMSGTKLMDALNLCQRIKINE